MGEEVWKGSGLKTALSLRPGSLLGIAISDREIVVAQVAGRRGRLQNYLRWEIPEGVSFVQPRVLGERLAAVLKEKGFTADKAVLGVPARWLIAERRELPPVGREQALSLMRLQAERLSAGAGSGPGDESGIVFDVAGDLSASQATNGLLVGISSMRLDQLRALCDAADIEPVGVTATGLALSQTFRRDTGDVLVLFGGHGTELVRRDEGQAVGLRHLNGVPTSGQGVLPALTAELSRALTLGSSSAHPAQSVVLIGESSLPETGYSELSERLGREVRSTTPLEALAEMSTVGSLNGEAQGVMTERIWPAIALAGLGAVAGRLPVNFLDPRLALPKESRISRPVVLGTLAGLLAVAALVWLILAVRSAEQEATFLEKELEDRAADIEAAQATIDEVRIGRTYFEKRPAILDPLADLARAFPEEGTIWVSTFTMRPDGKGQIVGRASDQQAILDVRDALMANPAFQNLQLPDQREASGRRGEWSFTLSFTYAAQTGSQPRGSEQP